MRKAKDLFYYYPVSNHNVLLVNVIVLSSSSKYYFFGMFLLSTEVLLYLFKIKLAIGTVRLYPHVYDQQEEANAMPCMYMKTCMAWY